MKKLETVTTILTILIMVVIIGLVATPVWADEAISDVLEADVVVLGEPGPQSVGMYWNTTQAGLPVVSPLSFTIEPDDQFDLWIHPINNAGFSIPRVVFILDGATPNQFDMEVTINATSSTPVTIPLSWSADRNAFYFGADTDTDLTVGFNMTADYSAKFRVRVTAKTPGDYTLRVFAVQLAAPEDEEPL
jgi:hypothetical protein